MSAILSKTTHNMAARRGFAFVEYTDDDGIEGFEVCALDEGEPIDEHHAYYAACRGCEGWTFRGGCFDTEEWPFWIESEAHLRRLVDAMADEVRSCKL